MMIVLRPHCSCCGYEFEFVNAYRDEEPTIFGSAYKKYPTMAFEPYICPKCGQTIEGIIFAGLSLSNNQQKYEYDKFKIDQAIKELEHE